MAQAQAEVERRRQETRGLAVVQHPSDLGSYFLSLDFYDYRTAMGDSKSAHNPENNIDPVRRLYNADRQSVNQQIAKKSSFAKIKLPIPGNLNDNFKVAWEDAALGGFAGIISDIAGGAGALFDGDLSSVGEEMRGTQYAVASSSIKAAARQVFNDTSAGALFDLFTGSAMNQNLAVLFRGPTLKTHQFKWRLVPKTPQESANIKKIIAILKRAQHPTQVSPLSSTVLRYPSECRLEFVSAKGTVGFLYPMRPCVLDSMSINYSPNGSLSLHQGTDAATAIDLTLVFKETSYYTRESFDNVNEYGHDGFNTADLTTGGVGTSYTETTFEPAGSNAMPTAPSEPTVEDAIRQAESMSNMNSNNISETYWANFDWSTIR